MRKFLFLSTLVLAGLFAVPAQQAKADHFGISFGIGVPGFYGGVYGRGYDYCPPSRYYYYDRPYYRSYYYRPYSYYGGCYPGYYYYGGPSVRFRYDYGDRYYRGGYRHYDRYDRYDHRRHH